MRIATMLDSVNGRVEAVDLPGASPFETCLAALASRQLPGGGVVFRVAAENRTLIVEGGADALRVLGGNLRDLAQNGDDGEHLHVEYFPDHFYLDESSLPVAVQVKAGLC